ncbi:MULTISPECIES: TonB-dependent receptor [unclassified Duganella]|uniref:TonB-dependent receptor n=1 Tax=unclassified Duganella TaxID=2636909 RepID=UPI00087FAE4A|nr:MULTISPECIES: TonB-dependent receptor [unclassified Duganella]SDF45512.1 iron complex outermembrane recepter protein [Duganella sp. OV458]SDI81271.1 iron complex outermembrane recepter protein [Duganella sp. OV510]
MIKLSKMHKRVLALGAILPIGTALAQTEAVATQPQLETVTVTAQRRTENIKDVPVSVTLLSNEKLDVLLSGGQDIRFLAGKVPSLNVESSNGRTFPRFYIRGYGNTDFSTFASQPVSLIYDDVVQENGILKGFPVFDVAGVEVLRGPQGTLFGRNTPAGVVKFESAKPNLDKIEGYYSASLATHMTSSVEAAANIPLSSEWAMRVSTLRQHRDDFVDNTYTKQNDTLEGYNEHAERVQFLYKPSTTFNALFNVHARSTTGSARLFRANLIKKGTNDFADGYDFTKISTDGLNFQNLTTNGANARLTWDLGSVKLFSITGYEGIDNYYTRGDIDGGSPANPPRFPVQTAGGIKQLSQYSQEFRVESKNAGPLNWQTGVYYFKESGTGFSDNFDSTTQLQTSDLTSHQNNTAYAAFGSVTYDVSSDFTLRGGLRYTHDEKDFRTVNAWNVDQIGPKSVDVSKNKANWDLSGTYKINKDVSAYGRVATGFRAPSIAAASASVPITVADAETITSIEAGIKADLFNRRARASLSVYNYEVKNQQLTVVGGTSNVTKLINAAKTAGRGVEAEIEGFVTPDFKVSLSGSYNHTEIKDPSLYAAPCGTCTVTDPIVNGLASINGNPLPQAAKYIVNASARYNWPLANGNLFVLTDWSYRSKVNFFLYESKEFTGKEMLEGGLRVGYNWADGKYELAGFARNITNTQRIIGGIDFNNLTGFVNEPRQFGVQFRGGF